MNVRPEQYYKKVNAEFFANFVKIEDACRHDYHWQDYASMGGDIFAAIKNLNTYITKVERNLLRENINEIMDIKSKLNWINNEIAKTKLKIPPAHQERFTFDYQLWKMRISLEQDIKNIYLRKGLSQQQKLPLLVEAVENQFLAIVKSGAGENLENLEGFIAKINQPNQYSHQFYIYHRFLADFLRHFYQQYPQYEYGYMLHRVQPIVNRIISPFKRQFAFPEAFVDERVSPQLVNLLADESKPDDGKNKEQFNKMITVLKQSAQDVEFKPITQPIWTEWSSRYQAEGKAELNTPKVVQQYVQQAILDYYEEARKNGIENAPLPTITNLANGFAIGGAGYPSPREAQEESILMCTDGWFGMVPAFYNSLDNYCFTKEGILASGLDKMGGSYRTQNCTLFGVPIVPLSLIDQDHNKDRNRLRLSKDEFVKFNQVVVAAPDFRQGKNKDEIIYNRYLADYYELNPNDYIAYIARAAHAQCQHTIATGSDTLIAGALGCGVFKNNPYMVALIHMAVFQHVDYAKLKIQFAITHPNLVAQFDFVFRNYQLLCSSELVMHIIDLCQGKPGRRKYAKHSLSELQSELIKTIEGAMPQDLLRTLSPSSMVVSPPVPLVPPQSSITVEDSLRIDRILYRALAKDIGEFVKTTEPTEYLRAEINSLIIEFNNLKEELIRALELSEHQVLLPNQAYSEDTIKGLQLGSPDKNQDRYNDLESEKGLYHNMALLNKVYALKRIDNLINQRILEEVAEYSRNHQSLAFWELRSSFQKWVEQNGNKILHNGRMKLNIDKSVIDQLNVFTSAFKRYINDYQNGGDAQNRNENFFNTLNLLKIQAEDYEAVLERKTENYRTDRENTLHARFLLALNSKKQSHSLPGYWLGGPDIREYIKSKFKDELILVTYPNCISGEMKIELKNLKYKNQDITDISSFFIVVNNGSATTQGSHWTVARVTLNHDVNNPTMKIDYVDSSYVNPLQSCPPQSLTAEIRKIEKLKRYTIQYTSKDDKFDVIPQQLKGFECGLEAVCQISYWLNQEGKLDQEGRLFEKLVDPGEFKQNYDKAIEKLTQEIHAEVLLNSKYLATGSDEEIIMPHLDKYFEIAGETEKGECEYRFKAQIIHDFFCRSTGPLLFGGFFETKVTRPPTAQIKKIEEKAAVKETKKNWTTALKPEPRIHTAQTRPIVLGNRNKPLQPQVKAQVQPNAMLIADIKAYFGSLSESNKLFSLFLPLVNAIINFNDTSPQADENFLYRLAEVCHDNKAIKNHLFHNTAEGLLVRAIYEAEGNINHWKSEIKSLNELMIAQQKREFIYKELSWNARRLSASGVTNWVRKVANQCLKKAILASEANVTLSSILAEHSTQMKQPVGYVEKENEKEIAYLLELPNIKNITIEEALSYNTGLNITETTSTELLNTTRDRLFSMNPKMILNQINPAYERDRAAVPETHQLFYQDLNTTLSQLAAASDRIEFARLMNKIALLSKRNQSIKEQQVAEINVIQEAFLFQARKQGGLIKLLEKLDATAHPEQTYAGGLRALLTSLYEKNPDYPNQLKQLSLLKQLSKEDSVLADEEKNNYRNLEWLLQKSAEIIFQTYPVGQVAQAVQHYALVEATIRDKRFWSGFAVNKDELTMNDLLHHIELKSRLHLYQQDYMKKIEKNPYSSQLNGGYKTLKEFYCERTKNFNMQKMGEKARDKSMWLAMDRETFHYLHALNYLMIAQHHSAPTTSDKPNDCRSLLVYVRAIYRAYMTSAKAIAKSNSFLTNLADWGQHAMNDNDDFACYQIMLREMEQNRDPVLTQAIVLAVKYANQNDNDPVTVDGLVNIIRESTTQKRTSARLFGLENKPKQKMPVNNNQPSQSEQQLRNQLQNDFIIPKRPHERTSLDYYRVSNS